MDAAGGVSVEGVHPEGITASQVRAKCLPLGILLMADELQWKEKSISLRCVVNGSSVALPFDMCLLCGLGNVVIV